MIQLKRIICPVDFSDFSRHALEHAVVLARWYGSEITVLHAFATPMALPMMPYGGPIVTEPIILPAAQRDQLEKDLTAFVQPVSDAGVSMSLQIVEGPAVDQILVQSKEKRANLIVMGTHGRSGFERLLLGSVAEKVLRKAPCPVLTVPPRVIGAAPPSFRRILSAVDFSESSMCALQYALSLAQEADAALTVVHVLELLPEAEAFELSGFNYREYSEALSVAARQRLGAAIPAEAREYCAIDEVISTGKAYREILRLADERQSDLVVMGVLGRGAADLMLFGSTTQHVVRQARCPVLTLRT